MLHMKVYVIIKKNFMKIKNANNTNHNIIDDTN